MASINWKKRTEWSGIKLSTSQRHSTMGAKIKNGFNFNSQGDGWPVRDHNGLVPYVYVDTSLCGPNQFWNDRVSLTTIYQI